MRFWEDVMKKDLTFEEIISNYEDFYFTRPEWDGFHFFDVKTKEHMVLLKSGKIIKISHEEVWNKDSNDWMLVSITNEALAILDNYRNKIVYKCPYCLRDNAVPNEDLEHNVQCHYCEIVFGVVNDTEVDTGFTCGEFRDAELIQGEEVVR